MPLATLSERIRAFYLLVYAVGLCMSLASSVLLRSRARATRRLGLVLTVALMPLLVVAVIAGLWWSIMGQGAGRSVGGQGER